MCMCASLCPASLCPCLCRCSSLTSTSLTVRTRRFRTRRSHTATSASSRPTVSLGRPFPHLRPLQLRTTRFYFFSSSFTFFYTFFPHPRAVAFYLLRRRHICRLCSHSSAASFRHRPCCLFLRRPSTPVSLLCTSPSFVSYRASFSPLRPFQPPLPRSGPHRPPSALPFAYFSCIWAGPAAAQAGDGSWRGSRGDTFVINKSTVFFLSPFARRNEE